MLNIVHRCWRADLALPPLRKLLGKANRCDTARKTWRLEDLLLRLPLAHRRLSLAHRRLPLAHRRLPLAHGRLTLAHQRLKELLRRLESQPQRAVVLGWLEAQAVKADGNLSRTLYLRSEGLTDFRRRRSTTRDFFVSLSDQLS